MTQATDDRPRERRTAGERRDEIVGAAVVEFGRSGFEGGSTDAIARRVGISQPYLFRLFPTKKALFIATVTRCFEDTRLLFETAAGALRGKEALVAMGEGYVTAILNDPVKLRCQLQAYAACEDPEIREVVREGFHGLVELVHRLSGEPVEQVTGFFASGMLLNVLAATGVLQSDERWAQQIREGCMLMC